MTVNLFPGRVFSVDERLSDERSVNATFIDTEISGLYYTKFDAVSLLATRNISSEKELFVNYGKNCEFK